MMYFTHRDGFLKVSTMARGVWCRYFHGPYNKCTAACICPRCGHVFCLADHTIHAGGAVFPSVVCPHKDCGFHEMVVLRDWKPWGPDDGTELQRDGA